MKNCFENQLELTRHLNQQDLQSLLTSVLNSDEVLDRASLASEIQALKDEQIDGIGSIRTYHSLLDQLVKVIQTPDFIQVWRTTNEALTKAMCRRAFDVATDEKTVLVKLVPIINKICDSSHESSFLYSILDPHNQIVAFSANVFETFCH